MDPDDFELEARIRKLTLDQDSVNETEGELAELIARCVADLNEEESQEPPASASTEDVKKDASPTSLIVTNLPQPLFKEPHLKTEFESLFLTFDEAAVFHYLRSFRRARVDLSSAEVTAKARVHLHQTPFGETIINCYFGHPPLGPTHQFLQLPPPVRQFLISPPASPPVGWEPAAESGPVVNFDLLAAIATLGPGEPHELLPPTESQPGIVVHICEDGQAKQPKASIVQTSCPERN
nr:EOG090X0FJX [Leptodora kindtii]